MTIKVTVQQPSQTIKTSTRDSLIKNNVVVTGSNPGLTVVTESRTLANGDVYLTSSNLTSLIETYIDQHSSNAASVAAANALATLAYATAQAALNTSSAGISANGGSVYGSLAVSNTVYANTITSNTITLQGAVITSTVGTTTASGTQVVIDQWASSMFTTAKYVIQIQTVDHLQATELFVMQDGINTYLTEYATLLSNAVLGTFSAIISSGQIQLLLDPQNPLNEIMSIKVLRQTILT